MKKLFCFVSVLLLLTGLFSPPAFATNETVDLSTIKSLLVSLLEQQYYYSLEGNESGFIVKISEEGIAKRAVSVLYGAIDRKEWKNKVSLVVDYANSISNFLSACGIENPNLLLIVLDDIEYKTTILAIYNGAVIYDFTCQNTQASEETKQPSDEKYMRNLICKYFESQGLKIKRVLMQPLVEKDDGLYSGSERWRITFENGEQILTWVKDEKITYCYGGIEYDDAPLT